MLVGFTFGLGGIRIRVHIDQIASPAGVSAERLLRQGNSPHFNVDRFRLCLFVLRYMHFQEPVPEFRADLVAGSTLRENETANKSTVALFNPVIFLPFLFLFGLAFVRDGEDAVFRRDLYLVLVYGW